MFFYELSARKKSRQTKREIYRTRFITANGAEVTSQCQPAESFNHSLHPAELHPTKVLSETQTKIILGTDATAITKN